MTVAAIVDLAIVTLRVSTPLILAAVGVLISSQAGVLNIGIEGMMLSGAFAGVIASAWTASALAGLIAAIVIGACLGLLLAAAVQVLQSDLVLTGLAINLAAMSGTTLLLFLLTGEKGISSSLHSEVLPNIDIPLLEDIPMLGRLLSGHHVLTYLALLSVPCAEVFLKATPTGLRLRAVGEDPHAAAAAGVNVVKIQCAALCVSGALAGAAGAFLSMGYVTWFSQNMSAGRGFIAVAADVMGQGSAFGTLIAAIVLGFAQTISISLQTYGFPSELMQTVPYVVPVIALVLNAARARRAVARRDRSQPASRCTGSTCPKSDNSLLR